MYFGRQIHSQPQDGDILRKKKKRVQEFDGPIAAVLTPFDKNGALNTSQILPYAKYLTTLGVKGVYILGADAGESFALSLEEKFSLCQAWRTAIDYLATSEFDHKLLAIVNVSSVVVGDIIKLVAKVEELDFDAIALLPPVYYHIATQFQLVRYLGQILERAGQTLPLVYDHNPEFTGDLKFELESFLELSFEKIAQFTALKYCDSNLARFTSIQSKFGSKLKILPALDEILLPTTTLTTPAVINSPISLAFNFADSLKSYRSYQPTDKSAPKWHPQQQDDSDNHCHQSSIASSIKFALNRSSTVGLNFGAARKRYCISKIVGIY